MNRKSGRCSGAHPLDRAPAARIATFSKFVALVDLTVLYWLIKNLKICMTKKILKFPLFVIVLITLASEMQFGDRIS